MTNPVFKTAREAAIAALAIAIPLAKRDRWEYGGFVLTDPNGFTYGPIVTDRDSHSVGTAKASPPDLLAREDELHKRVEHYKAIGLITEDTETDDPDPRLQALVRDRRALKEEIKARIAGSFHVHLTEGLDADGDKTDYPSGKYFSGQDIANAAKTGWLAWLGHTDSGKVFELDGRSKETLLASTGERRHSWDFVDEADREQARIHSLFQAVLGGPPPILARGIEIYGGYEVEQPQKEAA